MNREIKFRAWHRVEETMLFVGDKFGTTDPLDCCRYLQEGQPVDLMQYTGLKDKNGVEIYEGDILAPDNERERGSYHIYKIEYNAEKARFIGADGDEISCMPSIVNHHDGAGRYILIGNIYENPELTNP